MSCRLVGRSMAQVPDDDQLLVDDCVHLAAVPEVALQQEAVAAREGAWAEAAREAVGAEAAREAAGAGKDSW